MVQKPDIRLSAVVPVYNDEEVLRALLERLKPALKLLTEAFEIILIDDGSSDASWPVIRELAAQHSEVQGLKLVRNFGQQGAIKAGLDHSSGDLVVIMDSDLQDRPEDISLLIDSLETNKTDMAIAQWVTREDNILKVFVSAMFYRFSNAFTSIRTEPRLGIFRVVRRSVIEELKRFPEKSATPISLLYFIGCNYSVVPLKRDPRAAGTSGYNLRKMLSLTLARLFSFSMVPIRLATYSGLVVSFMSFVLGLFLIYRRITGDAYPGWTSITVLILFLFGLNFAFMGIIGEYLGKIFIETKQRPAYMVGTTTNAGKTDDL